MICQFFCVFTVFDSVESYAPGFKQSIVGKDILAPPDLEREFGLTGGVLSFYHHYKHLMSLLLSALLNRWIYFEIIFDNSKMICFIQRLCLILIMCSV